MNNLMNRFIKIVRNDGDIICQGKCISQKIRTLQLVSIDNKYFFHVEKSKNYRTIETDIVETIEFDKKKYETKLNLVPFVVAMSGINKGQITGNGIYDIDVFVENNEKELDKEMVEIVRSLNLIKGLRTTGSCSGHYVRKPWVVIEFKTLDSLTELNMVVNNEIFNKVFQLSNDSKVKLVKGAYPSMTLFCNKKLPFAVKHLKKLVEYLNRTYE